MNVLNDVTAAPFLVGFFYSWQLRKKAENGAALTSLGTFVRSNDFKKR